MKYQQLADQFRETISLIWDFLLGFVPKLILGLIVLVLGYFMARIVQSVIKSLIGYLDRVINNKLNTRYLQVNLSSSKKFISKMFFWVIIFFFITLFTEIIGLPVITSWLTGLGEYIPNLLAGIIIVFFGVILGRLAADLIKSGSLKVGIANSTILSKIVQNVILVITIIIAIDQAGLDISFLTILIYILLATLLMGASLAFAFGAKTSVSNILASYYISKNYSVGNIIKIDEHEGKIVKITSTSVFLESESGQVIIPAKEFNEKKSILIEKG